MLLIHGEAIEVSPPAVPGRDQGADDLTLSLSHHQRTGGFGDQTLEMLDAIRRARVAAALALPEGQHRREIAALPRPDRSFHGAQRLVALPQADDGRPCIAIAADRDVRDGELQPDHASLGEDPLLRTSGGDLEGEGRRPAPALLLKTPAPETITVPGPGRVTGRLAVPFLLLMIAFPIVNELSGAERPAGALARGERVVVEGAAVAVPEREAVSGPLAELLMTVTSAVALPATLGSNAAEKWQEPPGGIGAPVQEVDSESSNWPGSAPRSRSRRPRALRAGVGQVKAVRRARARADVEGAEVVAARHK